jgi:hypothetical protein
MTPQWRVFLSSLAEEIVTQGGEEARNELLRGIGLRMAKLRPILVVSGLDMIAVEMNDQLGALGWGSTHLQTDDNYPTLQIVHAGLPRISTASDPSGTWLCAVLEGLYQGWFAQLPNYDDSMAVRLLAVAPRTVTLRYSRREKERQPQAMGLVTNAGPAAGTG